MQCNLGACADCIIEHSTHTLVKLDNPVLELRFEFKALVGKMEDALMDALTLQQVIQTRTAAIVGATHHELA